MKRSSIIGAALAVAALAAPGAAYAQGVGRGAAEGAAVGNRAAGPVGGAVGGAVGGVVGGVNGAVAGILGIDQRPRFHEYVVREHRPSYHWGNEVRVGAVLPENGVTYYDVPAEYHVRPGYRYTVIDNRTVLVDPVTHEVVEVLE